MLDDDKLSAIILGYHRQLGLFVLLLWVVRLAMRWSHGQNLHGEKLPSLIHWVGIASHTLLYGLLFTMPVLGLAMTNARGRAVSLLNVILLPSLVATDPDLADTLQDWHKFGAWLLIGLISAHILAALWHHWIRRDGVLVGMLPLLRRRKQP